MAEYDNNIQHFAPVLRRIVILVAVLVAIPVVLWTITAFMRTYIAQPSIPEPKPLATTSTVTPTATASTNSPASTAAVATPRPAMVASATDGHGPDCTASLPSAVAQPTSP